MNMGGPPILDDEQLNSMEIFIYREIENTIIAKQLEFYLQN